jgi:peptidoglycan/xylan/chitin deacetylase (PgdA/CDA1 family)
VLVWLVASLVTGLASPLPLPLPPPAASLTLPERAIALAVTRTLASRSAQPSAQSETPPPPSDASEAARFGNAGRMLGWTRPGMIALTFDDGPDHATTPRVLAALDAYRVPATFFVVGWRFDDRSRRDRKNAAVLRDIARRGHAIGNHTLEHDDLTAMSARRMEYEIDHTERMVKRVLGYRPYLFRAPFGAMNGRVRRAVARRGYTEVRWNIDVRDWRRQPWLAHRVLGEVFRRDGGIVLLHDTKSWTSDALPGLLAELEEENCRRLLVDEPPLLPVPLDYFLREVDGRTREIPAHARQAVQRYRDHLQKQCVTRLAEPVTRSTDRAP